MKAEVIAIGDELTSGQRLDTNSQWISQRLAEIGVQVLFHTTVGDDLHANVRVFREAFDRADVVVCTGGLGPTADDLTRQALAAAVDRDLVQFDEALSHIRNLFARRGRPMPERNVVQAMFARGSRMIPNPHGSAPGVLMEVARDGRAPSLVFALPGVPAEMTEMFRQSVVPRLEQALAASGEPRRIIVHHRIKCFGAGESDLEQMLPDIIRRGRQPSVGITVHKATITLRISVEGQSIQQCRQLMAPTQQTIKDCLKDLVFGEEDDELQHVVMRIMAQRNLTLATCAPNGVLSDWLAEANINRTYLGGLVLCGPTISGFRSFFSPSDRKGAEETSADFAVAAARQVREEFGADYGLAMAAFPERTEDSGAPPVAYGAIADAASITPFEAPFSAHPDIVIERAIKHALNELRKNLLAADSE